MIQPLSLAAGAVLAATVVQERRLRRRAERFTAAALESLLRAIDANDPQTGAHVRRVADYSLILAEALGVDDTARRTIELTALFHDVGKIHEALFDIVHEGRALTPEERRAIDTHPIRGADVLSPIAHFHPELAEAVLSHHERWDGTGYPRGLRGLHIPLAARVVSLADTFDAVTHVRRYRHQRTATEAEQIIAQGRGTQFDPDLADLMLLPPVFGQIMKARQAAAKRTRGTSQRRERGSPEAVTPPHIRWRSRSKTPASVRLRGSERSEA